VRHGPRTGLGRASMSVVCTAALVTAGCLDDAPDYPAREQIPPFIIAAQVTPSLGEVYDDGIPMNLNVPFRSEDNNEDLVALIVLDRGSSTAVLVARQPIQASTYGDTSRAVSYPWQNELGLRGCHSLTLLITYDFNLVGNEPRDETLTASVVWWTDIDDQQGMGTVLIRTCPRLD
jgi:hypothetical protein